MSKASDITGVQKALLAKQQAIISGAELLASKTSDWQIIRDYLCNRVANIKLTKKQEEKMNRYQFVYNQLSSGKYLDKEVVSQLEKNFGIEHTQAYEDLRDAKDIFNVLFNINRQFELKLTLDRNWVMLQKAEAAGDTKAYAALEKNRTKLLEMIPEEDKTLIDDFVPHTYILKFDPSLIGAPEVDMKAIMDYINQRRKGGNTSGIEEAEVVNG